MINTCICMYINKHVYNFKNPPGPLVTVYSAAGCCLSPTASVTWQHILTSARFQREHSIHQVKLPQALLTAMRSSATSRKAHTGFLLLFAARNYSRTASKSQALRRWHFWQRPGAKGRFDWNYFSFGVCE